MKTNSTLLSDYILTESFQNISNEYTKRNMLNTIELTNEVSKFYPAIAYIDVTDNYSYVCLKHNYLKLIIKKDSKNKYLIYSNFEKFANISKYDMQDIFNKQFIAPNQIGVLTTKKINAWVKYYEDVYNAINKLNNEKGNEIEIFLKSIEGLPIKWNYKKTGGEIIKNGIEFTFNISDGYVSKKINLHYSISNNLETFLKLSDNKMLLK